MFFDEVLDEVEVARGGAVEKHRLAVSGDEFGVAVPIDRVGAQNYVFGFWRFAGGHA